MDVGLVTKNSILIIVEDIPKNSASPPQTPCNILSFEDFLMFAKYNTSFIIYYYIKILPSLIIHHLTLNWIFFSILNTNTIKPLIAERSYFCLFNEYTC